METQVDIDMVNAGLAREMLALKIARANIKKQKMAKEHEVRMAQLRFQQTQLEASIAFNTSIPHTTQFPHFNAAVLPMAQFPHVNIAILPTAQFPHINTAVPLMTQFPRANAAAPPIATPPTVQVGTNDAEGQGAYAYGTGLASPSLHLFVIDCGRQETFSR